MKPNKISNILILVLSALGFLDATYLTVKFLLHQEVICSATAGCSTVLNSAYARIGPIPTSMLGVFYYLALIVLSGMMLHLETGKTFRLISITVGLGFVVSALLVGLQAFVIHSYCTYCLMSAAITTILFVIVCLESLGYNKTKAN